jgi:hypothetical protein
MADEQEKDSGGSAEWMQKLWRPAMGWMYMLICLLDMAVFPVLWSVLQATMHMPITQWNPLTLQGAGLFHIAMGAVLGISAFGRTQEKLAGTAANPTATSQTITNNQNMSGNVAGGFGSNQGGGMGGGFGGSSGSFGAPASGGFGAPASGGFGAPASGGFGGASNGGFNSSPSGASAFGASSSGGFGAPAGGFGSPAPSFGSTPAPAASGFGGGGLGSTPTTTAPAINASGKKVIPTFDQPAI